MCVFRYSVDGSQAAGFKQTMSHLVPDLIDANESDLWLPANSVMVCHLISSQLYTGSFVVPADWLQGVCCVMQDL